MFVLRKSTLLPLAGLISALPLVLCYSLADGGEIIAGNVAASDGPYDIPRDTFRGLTSRPNATSSIDFSMGLTGPNSTTSRWTLDIGVTADMPVDEKVSQVTILSLTGPEGSVNALNDTWSLCAAVFGGVSANATAAAQNADLNGDCRPTLSDNCRNELTSAMLDEYALSGDCGIPTLPSTCKAYFPESFRAMGFGLTPEILSNHEFLAFGSAPQTVGNHTAYDMAGTNVWPVLLTWNEAGSTTNSSILRCIHATDLSEGSDAPGVPDAAARNLSLPAAWMIVLIVSWTFMY